LQFQEFEISLTHIKILTSNKALIDLLKQDKVYSNIELVNDYLSGIQLLNIDFNKVKKIPIEFLKQDSTYILDLFDDVGDVRIPAFTKVTQNMLDYFKSTKVRYLTYYADVDINEITNSNDKIMSPSMLDKAYSAISQTEYEVLESDTDLSEIQNDKLILFFRNLKGFEALAISSKEEEIISINETFKDYLNLYTLNSGEGVMDLIEKQKIILVFLEIELNNPSALEILQNIRKKMSRRKVTVIIIANKIDRITLSKFKDAGTDYVLIKPFTNTKLLNKTFSFLTADRNN
jgi:CheY-like chemotaxis protein